MRLTQLIKVATGYADLGQAIQEQLEDVIEGRADECNANAFPYIKRWLEAVKKATGSVELARDVDEALENIKDVCDDERSVEAEESRPLLSVQDVVTLGQLEREAERKDK